jgi:hypothetical protein
MKINLDYIIAQYKDQGYFPLVLVPTRETHHNVDNVGRSVWQLLGREPALYDPCKDLVMLLLSNDKSWIESNDMMFVQSSEQWEDVHKRVSLAYQFTVSEEAVDVSRNRLIDVDAALAFSFIKDRIAVSAIDVELTSNVRNAIRETWTANHG